MVIKAALLWRPIPPLSYKGYDSLNTGDLIKVPLGTQRVRACVVDTGGEEQKGLKEVEKVLHPRLFPSSLITLCRRLAREHLGFMGEALGLALPRDIINPPRESLSPGKVENKRPLRMRPDERRLLEKLKASARPVLAHSPADYTALMVRLAEEELSKSKQVLILCPHEPALARFWERLHPYLPLTPYHSQMGQAHRRRVWHGLREGKVDLILGLRSAVLLPFTNQGLIMVIDEESDLHHVRSHHLHYNARDLALESGEIQGARVILFSLAPAVETSHRARAGKMRMLEARVAQKGKAVIADMRKEPEGTLISKALRAEMKAAGSRNMGVVLVLNRLGRAARMLCKDCGHVLSCEKCGFPLKLIRPGKPLVCPLCSREYQAPEKCPECGGVRWQQLSQGLDNLERALKREFPAEKLCRIAGDERPVLDEVNGARVIYGTSAALEYLPPKIQTAALLSWDAQRCRPDFRSAERAFREVAYLRRILASTPSSRLVVQTYRPWDGLLSMALKADYQKFFAGEVRRRRELGYPPYHRLVLFQKRSSKAWDADKLISSLGGEGVELLGPYAGKNARVSVLAKLRRDLSPADLITPEQLYKSGWQAEVDPVEVL